MQDFTIHDIRDFIISELSLDWSGDIFDEEKGVYRKAEVSDFNTLKTTKFKVEDKKGLTDLKIILYGNKFTVVDGEDLSLNWIKFKNERELERISSMF